MQKEQKHNTDWHMAFYPPPAFMTKKFSKSQEVKVEKHTKNYLR